MRVGLVRNVGLGMSLLLLVGMSGCDDNPVDFDVSESTSLFANPTTMQIAAGRVATLETRALNQGGQPTFEEISWAIDGSCGDGIITVEESPDYVPEVDPPVQLEVTGGNTWGETCIDISNAGGDLSRTIEVMVVADSLEILNAPDADSLGVREIAIFSSVQLSAALLSDDGQPVGPFDPATDIVWESDDETVATVDATGLVNTVGTGSAIITATWTEFGVDVTASVPLSVVVPAPTLTSTDVGAAAIGDMVTVTGTGLIPGAHSIFVDGLAVNELLEPTIVDATTATFLMPGGAPDGAAGTVEVTIGVAGTVSNGLNVDRTDADEPANDDPTTAPSVSLPADVWGFIGGGDIDDFWTVTVTGPTTLDLFMIWDSDADLDVVVTDATATVVLCTLFTTNNPEEGQCDLPAAGSYQVIATSYSGGGTYNLQVSEAP